jgi:hypothetical protein
MYSVERVFICNSSAKYASCKNVTESFVKKALCPRSIHRTVKKFQTGSMLEKKKI